MNIQVYPHRIILNKTNEVNTGEYNVNECTFEFSQEYEGLTKVAVFSLCDGTTKNVTILNNQCIIPVECLQETGQVQIGVYGYATQDNELVLRYSPTPQNFVVRLGSYKEGTQPVAPTPTDWEILVEQVNDIAEDVSSIHEDITGINGEISGINIDIRDLQDTKANISDLAEVAFTGEFSDLKNIPSYATTQQLNQEIQDRQDADVNLQSQIDAISASSDVVDVVGTYQELLNYDTTHLKDNDIVKVLKDSTHSDALSYYRWDKETSTWSYVGSEGPFYTKSETDALLNDKQDVIDIDNMLSSDLVDDTNSTNKFVTQADITNWNNKEDKSNKVTEINSSSTDTQYPSAKCVYDSQEEQNEHIAELEMLYNAFPTVSDEDTTIQLDNTAKVKFREIDLKGNTSQVVIPEEQGTSVSNTSIYVSDVDTDKESSIEMSGNTSQTTTSISGGDEYDSPSPDHPQPIEVVTGTQNVTIANSDNTQSTTYPVNLGNIELCKIDTYQDKIYKQNDKWYLEKYIEKNTVNGTENWLKSGSTLLDRFILNVAKPNMTFYKAYSNYFINTSDDATTIKTFYMDASNTSSLNGRLVINFSNYGTTTIEQFKTWLSNNNVNTYYVPSATPTTTEITDTNLVNQLNALYNANIYPITNINTDTSNLLPYIDLHYNFVTPSPSPSRPSVVNVVKGNNTITIANSDNTESQVFPINLGDMELCKIETYQDYIYENNGNWYKKGNIGKVTLNGSEDWNFYSTADGNLFRYNFANMKSADKLGICLCNKFEVVAKANRKNYTLSGDGPLLDFIDNDFENANEWKYWLNNNNILLYYVLATPTDTQITDNTLITQLNNIKKAYSYDTQTNISQTNTDKPFIIYAEAIRSLKDVFE